MTRPGFRPAYFFFFFLLLPCCALQPISREERRQADPSLTYSRVVEDPEAYTGATVIWGGVITGVRNFQGGSEITILQNPLGPRASPDARTTQGEFLAQTPDFLDPVIYRVGRGVTIVGEVLGKGARRLKEFKYTYPVLRIRQAYLWSPRQPLQPPDYTGWRWQLFQPPYPPGTPPGTPGQEMEPGP